MSELVSTYQHAGLTVEIHTDDTPFDPRKDHDNAATIYQFNEPRSGEWGDERATFEGERECPRCEGYREDPERAELIRGRFLGRVVGAGTWEAMNALWMHDVDARNADPDRDHGEPLSVRKAPCLRCEGQGSIPATLTEWIEAEHGSDAVWLPIAHWDDWRPALRIIGTGEREARYEAADPDGFIVCDWETAQKEWPSTDPAQTRKDCEACMRAEVEEYSSYLQGDVFGYVIKAADGGELPDFVALEDSCWGFIGDEDGYVTEEANHAAEYVAEQLRKEEAEREAWAARDITTEEVTQ